MKVCDAHAVFFPAGSDITITHWKECVLCKGTVTSRMSEFRGEKYV
jgi:hypothetical protein